MSYHIIFFNKKDLDIDNIFPFLEEDAYEEDDFFISKELMIKIKETLFAKGLKFKTFERKDEDYIELNFPTYQISMFNSQITISIPFWHDNNDEQIRKDIELIKKTFIEYGLTGFDPQTEEFISEKYNLHESFTETNFLVNNYLTKILKKVKKKIIYIAIAFLLIVF